MPLPRTLLKAIRTANVAWYLAGVFSLIAIVANSAWIVRLAAICLLGPQLAACVTTSSVPNSPFLTAVVRLNPLARPPAAIAPEFADGFFLVPRHGAMEEL